MYTFLISLLDEGSFHRYHRNLDSVFSISAPLFLLFSTWLGSFKTEFLIWLKHSPLLQVGIGSLLVWIFAHAPWPSGAPPWVLPVQQAVSAVFQPC
jgi:hypothetical protein